MANVVGKVVIHGVENLATFIATLVREGIVFNAFPQTNDVGITSYVVEFNGGY